MVDQNKHGEPAEVIRAVEAVQANTPQTQTQTQEKVEPNRGALDATSDLYAKFFRGLGDPTRVKIVQLLLEQPRTVGELVELLGSPQGRVSSHLTCLRWCGFVEGNRDGRNVTYRVTDLRVRTLISTAHELLEENAQRVASCFIVDTRQC